MMKSGSPESVRKAAGFAHGGVLACCGLAGTRVDRYDNLLRTNAARHAAPSGCHDPLVHRPNLRSPSPSPSAFGRCRPSRADPFDSGVTLRRKYPTVVELSSTLTMPRPNFPVVNFPDAGGPLSVLLTAELTQ